MWGRGRDTCNVRLSTYSKAIAVPHWSRCRSVVGQRNDISVMKTTGRHIWLYFNNAESVCIFKVKLCYRTKSEGQRTAIAFIRGWFLPEQKYRVCHRTWRILFVSIYSFELLKAFASECLTIFRRLEEGTSSEWASQIEFAFVRESDGFQHRTETKW